MYSFPSIQQFRHVVEAVRHRATYVGQTPAGTPSYDYSRPQPKLTFIGRPKLHGTNGGVTFELGTGEVYAQSRERRLTAEEDNHGFHAFIMGLDSGRFVDVLQKACLLAAADAGVPVEGVAITVYGEFCGPSINGKAAIGQLPDERWVIFSVIASFPEGARVRLPAERLAAHLGELYSHLDVDFRGVNVIIDFDFFMLEIDFNDPGASLAALERYTLQVEESCPVARLLGVDGLGEGIVWTCEHPTYGRLTFKTKGDKHKGTKNRRLVDIAPEVLASREAFVTAVLTDSRLEQGFDILRAHYGTVTLDHMGEFLAWIGRDVLKEEGDSLDASGLERKEVMGLINRCAKAWITPRLSPY